jgi:hypothetical protein
MLNIQRDVVTKAKMPNWRGAVIAAVAAAVLSLPIMSAPQAQEVDAAAPAANVASEKALAPGKSRYNSGWDRSPIDRGNRTEATKAPATYTGPFPLPQDDLDFRGLNGG